MWGWFNKKPPLDWSTVLSEDPLGLRAQRLSPDHDIHQIPFFLSPDECQRIITEADAEDDGYSLNIDGLCQHFIHSEKLADRLWDRVQPIVHEYVYEDGEPFKAVGLTSQMQVTQYFSSDRRRLHVDKSYEPSLTKTRTKTMYSFIIYLNESVENKETKLGSNVALHSRAGSASGSGNFRGGITRFRLPGKKIESTAETTEKEPLPPIILDVIPKTGMCLLFRQPPTESLPHEERPVVAGMKYILHADIVYKRVGIGCANGNLSSEK